MWVQQGREHPDDGRLAGSVGPEEAEHLALVDAQVHAIDGDDVAKMPDEARCLDNDRHVLTAANPRLPGSAFIGSAGSDRMPLVAYEVERR